MGNTSMPPGQPTPEPQPYIPTKGKPKNAVARTDGVTTSVVPNPTKPKIIKDFIPPYLDPAKDDVLVEKPFMPKDGKKNPGQTKKPQSNDGTRKPAKDLNTSDMGLQFIIDHEGVRRKPYNDSKGYATIGIGHLLHKSKVTSADKQKWGTLKDQQVIDLFRKDIVDFEDQIKTLVSVPLTQQEFDAIVSFAYNVGIGGLAKSDFLTKLNDGTYDGDLMLHYHKPPEIVSRRKEEVLLFNKHIYQSSGKPTKLDLKYFSTVFMNNNL